MLICRPWRKSARFPLPHSRSRLPLSEGRKAVLLETQGSCSPRSRRAQAASSTVTLAKPPLPLPSSSRKGKRQDRTSKPTLPLPLFLGELKQKVRFCDSLERKEGGGSKGQCGSAGNQLPFPPLPSIWRGAIEGTVRELAGNAPGCGPGCARWASILPSPDAPPATDPAPTRLDSSVPPPGSSEVSTNDQT